MENGSDKDKTVKTLSPSNIAHYLATHGKEKPARLVDSKELAMGIEVELEHCNSKKVAEVIARQHLSENPHYYSQGKKAGLFEELKKSIVPVVMIKSKKKKLRAKPTWNVKRQPYDPDIGPTMDPGLVSDHGAS